MSSKLLAPLGQMMIVWGVLSCQFLLLVSTSIAQNEELKEEPANEFVMLNGMSISATNGIGTIKIRAGSGYERIYEWDGFSRSLMMGGRKSRWNGSFGLAFVGSGDHWVDAAGIRRAVTEEGWRHFRNEDDAIEWIKSSNDAWNKYNRTRDVAYVVYSKDGLVVIWSKLQERKQLSVEVWQLVIDGKKPKRLPGANDGAIDVGYRRLDEVEKE